MLGTVFESREWASFKKKKKEWGKGLRNLVLSNPLLHLSLLRLCVLQSPLPAASFRHRHHHHHHHQTKKGGEQNLSHSIAMHRSESPHATLVVLASAVIRSINSTENRAKLPSEMRLVLNDLSRPWASTVKFHRRNKWFLLVRSAKRVGGSYLPISNRWIRLNLRARRWIAWPEENWRRSMFVNSKTFPKSKGLWIPCVYKYLI